MSIPDRFEERPRRSTHSRLSGQEAYETHPQSDRPSIPPQRRHRQQHSNKPLIIAVILAMLIVGSTVWYTQFRAEHAIVLPEPNSTTDAALRGVRDVQSNDHIRGNPNARVVYVVYFDFGCPFCKEYHSTMQRLVERYGRNGDVAIVYRNMPLIQLHPQANVYALAGECIADNAGNQAFWKFADLFFAAKTPTKEVSASELVALANQSGVGTDTFTACMNKGEFEQRIQEDFDEARAAGAEGTPFTILLTDTQRVVITGTHEYLALAAATEAILNTLGATHLESPSSGNSASEQFMNDLRTSTSTSEHLPETIEASRATTTQLRGATVSE